jgi:hypothetical protein
VKVDLRLFHMKQHSLLNTLNYLDDESRKNSFIVMGWPRDNYLKRQAILIKQVANQEQMMRDAKMEKTNEIAEDKTDGEGGAKGATEATSDAGAETATVAEEANKIAALGEDKTDDEGGANGANEATSDAGAEPATVAEEVNEFNALGEDKTDDEGEAKCAVESAPDAGEEPAIVAEEAKDTAAGVDRIDAKVAVESASDTGADDLLTIAPGVTISKDDPRILPLLSAPIDAETLLARLNNRRLYARILHYKREQRKKPRETDKDLDGYGSLKEDDNNTYEQALKDQKTADRLYRKNMTITQMANREWDELLEVGNLRLNGKADPYYPIPTQHELLLFSKCPREVGVLASYPRSGNSLMRTLYEHTTLRVTGSDMQGGLAKHDLVGECAVDAKFVQFVKTHFPERQGNPQFRASRVVLLVRNPFDAIESYFNLMMTGKHTDTITPAIRAKTVKYWEEYVLKEIKVWKLFHAWWLDQDVPLLLIRYEDLVRWPDKVMGRVLSFVLEVKR